jgi:hypothetical protein
VQCAGFRAGRTVLVTAAIYAIVVIALNRFAFTEAWDIIWPLNGVNIAVLLMRPRSSWIWMLLGIELGTGIGDSLDGLPLWIKLFDRVCSVMEVVACALLLPRFTTLDEWLRTPRLYRRLIAALILGPGISGLISAAGFYYTQDSPFVPTLKGWAIADALGIAATMPLALSISSPQMRGLFRPQTVARTLRSGCPCTRFDATIGTRNCGSRFGIAVSEFRRTGWTHYSRPLHRLTPRRPADSAARVLGSASPSNWRKRWAVTSWWKAPWWKAPWGSVPDSQPPYS